MNIKQKIKELFHDSKKRNIVISCAAAIVILAVGIPVGFSIYGNNASPVTMAVASHQESGKEASSASSSRGNSSSKASSDKDSSSKSERIQTTPKPVPANRKIKIPIRPLRIPASPAINPQRAEPVPPPQSRPALITLPAIGPAIPSRILPAAITETTKAGISL